MAERDTTGIPNWFWVSFGSGFLVPFVFLTTLMTIFWGCSASAGPQSGYLESMGTLARNCCVFGLLVSLFVGCIVGRNDNES